MQTNFSILAAENFGIAHLLIKGKALDHQAPQRGSQIGKNKLSIRKTEERICKEGQKGGKEAPQASAAGSRAASGGDKAIACGRIKG
jgi:hypothetical protein